MSNVENIYRRRHRLRVRIGRKNVSLCHMQQSMDGSVFRCALEVVMVVEHLVTGDREFQTAGAMLQNALDWNLILVAN